jgi:hypothetical protein
MKANNFNVMKGLVECTGSMESGKKYASNGILEVALLDKFGPVSATGVVVPVKVETNLKISCAD